ATRPWPEAVEARGGRHRRPPRCRTSSEGSALVVTHDRDDGLMLSGLATRQAREAGDGARARHGRRRRGGYERGRRRREDARQAADRELCRRERCAIDEWVDRAAP